MKKNISALIVFSLVLVVVTLLPQKKLYADETINLPILMYHQISKKPSKLGKYVISPDEFENDLRFLTEKGYTTVLISDLIDYTNNNKALPEKPVMLTFDDGYESDYVYAFPLLKKYDMKAVFSIVGAYTDKFSDENIDKHIDYAYLSWDEVKEMNQSGLAEFQSHTYNMHSMGKRRGALKKKDESLEQYNEVLADDIEKLNDSFLCHINTTPTAFTCPFGARNESLCSFVRDDGFAAILTCQHKTNVLTGDPSELLQLNRFLRAHNTNIEQLTDW